MSRAPHSAGAVVTLTVIGCLAALAALAPPASAGGKGERRQAKHAIGRGDDPADRRIGNGHRNRNIVDVNSPTVMRGNQPTSTSNAGGVTNVQSGLCRNVRVCNITLQVIVQAPKPKKAQSAAQDDDVTEPAREADQGDGQECCCP
jgi:hypothetical protein